MLAMDIETLGLMSEVPLPPITCACLYDGVTSTRLLLYGNDPAEAQANAAALLRALDEADCIAGYNAVYFDLVYVRTSLGATDEQLHGWIVKCIDPFMCLKHIVRRPCKLQYLLELNGLGSKTGSGSNAIELARQGRFEELLDYCLMDAVLTFQLCCLEEVRLSDQLVGRRDVAGTWRLRYERPWGAAAVIPTTLAEALPSLGPDHVRDLYETVFMPDPRPHTLRPEGSCW